MKRAKRDHWYEAAVYWVGQTRYWKARALKAETELQEVTKMQPLTDEYRTMMQDIVDRKGAWGGSRYNSLSLMMWAERELAKDWLSRSHMGDELTPEEIEQSLPYGLKIETREDLPPNSVWLVGPDRKIVGMVTQPDLDVEFFETKLFDPERKGLSF